MRLLLLTVSLVAVIAVVTLAFRPRRGGERADAVDRLLAEADVLEQFGQRGRAAEILDSALETHPGETRLRERLEQLRR